MEKISNALLKIQKILIIIVLSVVLLVIFAGTVGRYTGLFRLFWAEELARYSIIWLVYITGGLCSLWDKHFSIETFIDMLPRIGKIIVYVIRILLMIAVCGFICYYGWQLVTYQFKLKQVSAALQLPFWFFYFCLPLGGFTTLAYYIVHQTSMIKREINNKKEDA